MDEAPSDKTAFLDFDALVARNEITDYLDFEPVVFLLSSGDWMKE
jgi:hypothetical protein